MIKESKYCSEVMKKHCNKELVTFKRDDEDLENATNCWICDKVYDDDDDDVKVKDHCHILENIEVLRIDIVISMLN